MNTSAPIFLGVNCFKKIFEILAWKIEENISFFKYKFSQ